MRVLLGLCRDCSSRISSGYQIEIIEITFSSRICRLYNSPTLWKLRMRRRLVYRCLELCKRQKRHKYSSKLPLHSKRRILQTQRNKSGENIWIYLYSSKYRGHKDCSSKVACRCRCRCNKLGLLQIWNFQQMRNIHQSCSCNRWLH